MQNPRIVKVVINMSIGKPGEELQKGMKVFQQLTNQKPYMRRAKKTIRDWGITKGTPIACVGTLRGSKAAEFLKRAFDAVRNKLPKSVLDSTGNFSFGIADYKDISTLKSHPDGHENRMAALKSLLTNLNRLRKEKQ